MKTTNCFATILFAAAARAAVTPAVGTVTITDRNGDVWTGENKSLLASRGLDARCDCGTSCYAWCTECNPGSCQCAGSNGCWSYNNGPYICQQGPGGSEWYSNEGTCLDHHPFPSFP